MLFRRNAYRCAARWLGTLPRAAGGKLLGWLLLHAIPRFGGHSPQTSRNRNIADSSGSPPFKATTGANRPPQATQAGGGDCAGHRRAL